MTPTKAQIEKTAREMFDKAWLSRRRHTPTIFVKIQSWGDAETWNKKVFRDLARWHLAQIAKVDCGSEREKVMRDILEKLAASKRKTGAQRLASSCLTFLDAMAKEKAKQTFVDDRCEVHDLLMGDGKCNCAKAKSKKKGTK